MKPKGWSQDTEDLQSVLEKWRKDTPFNLDALSDLEAKVLSRPLPLDGLDGPNTRIVHAVYLRFHS